MSPRDEQAGLLRGIVECPEDSAPRLIFADWLTDQGRPEWADFIRLHCAITPYFIGDSRPFGAFHSCPREQMALLPLCHLQPDVR